MAERQCRDGRESQPAKKTRRFADCARLLSMSCRIHSPNSNRNEIHNWYFRLPPSAFRLPPSAFRPIADALSPVGPTCWSAVTSLPASTAPLAGPFPATESLFPTLESPAPASAGPGDSTDGLVPSVARLLPSAEGLRDSAAGPSPAVERFSPSAEGLRESRSPTPLSPVSASPLTCLIERS